MSEARGTRLLAGLSCLALAVALSEARLHVAACAGVWAAVVLYFWEDLRELFVRRR